LTFRDRVRWSDVDTARIVYFGKFIRWIEAAEGEFFREHGITIESWETNFGVMLARVHLSIDFRSPARIDEWLVCSAELQKIGGSSLHFRFAIDRDETRIADATLVLACLDLRTMKPTRVPAAVRTALAGGGR
jgi:acyl-CoA thioester hydrolase